MAEEIVMTPSKKDDTTIINIEKVEKRLLDESQVAHKAGGQNTGLVINKQLVDDQSNLTPPQPHHLQLEFKCFLVDQKSGKHIPELRCLKFWFPAGTEYLDKVTSAYDFFRELVKPEQFPRDYVGFIKKIMKGMQHDRYNIIKRIQVDMRHLKRDEADGERKTEKRYRNQIYVNLGDSGGQDKRPKEVVVQDQLLLSLESAFPNVLPTETLMDMLKVEEGMLIGQMQLLVAKNLVKELEPGRWLRNVLDNKSELRIVKNLVGQVDGSKPKIAIVTSKYYEKVAVDAMMEKKTSFVRFKSEGESNVYTVGYIGPHKVVSTKLPMIGRRRDAQISSGNTTTRLLGTFGEIEHVLLVGVCGGVPQYADYYKHVRLGDIIVSSPSHLVENKNNGCAGVGRPIGGSGNGDAKDHFYLYCDKVVSNVDDNNNTNKNINNTNNNINNTSNNINNTSNNINNTNNNINNTSNNINNTNNNSMENSPGKQSISGVEAKEFSVRGWAPLDHTLLTLARKVAAGGGRKVETNDTSNNSGVHNNGINVNGSHSNNSNGGSNDKVNKSSSWQRYLREGQSQLEGQEVKFSRPPADTDRLFMKLGGEDVIEVGHPAKPEGNEVEEDDNPTIRFGLIGSGSSITSDDQLRLDFASKYQCIAFDSEIDQVLDSIEGSRKDSYLLLRGVADYGDGEKAVEWQAYAALAAAAFMKQLIEQLPVD